jgi:hypothetical protein
MVTEMTLQKTSWHDRLMRSNWAHEAGFRYKSKKNSKIMKKQDRKFFQSLPLSLILVY